MLRNAVRSICRAIPIAALAFVLPSAGTLRAEKKPLETAKSLSEATRKGLSWLIEAQLSSGGWSQGEESRQMGGHMSNFANVADSSMAALALLRSGSTPSSGPYAANLRRALEYVLGEVESSDNDSIFVTKVRGTRVQGKLGQAVDTFMSLTLLSEAAGRMPTAAQNARVQRATEKILQKMKRNQRQDGSFETSGWAPVLSQAMAAKGMNRAAQNGVAVDETLRARTESYAKDQMDAKGNFKGAGSAGVGLYSASANAAALQESASTNAAREIQVRRMAVAAPTTAQRQDAQLTLRRYEDTRAQSQKATQSLVGRLTDARFVAGFGNNGGEEFLSYMMVSENLRSQGGAQWRDWDAAMTRNLTHVQNGDGSWTGHHCITGRTFVTSAALLVLMADRAPVGFTKSLTSKPPRS
jgi:hypothetical protein